MRGDFVGYRALGRDGELGVVEGAVQGDAAAVVVRGGVSAALVYLVPYGRIHSVLPGRRAVVLDVAFTDFIPTLRDDGTIELRLALD